MYKKETRLSHSKLANDLMNYINNNIEIDIDIDAIANEMSVSKFHLHNIFKEQMGANIYEMIKSIRLQKASNLLISNTYSTITEIANECGYSSQASFLRAFKQRFGQTPKYWRNGGYQEYSNMILEANKSNSSKVCDFSHIKLKIVYTQPKKAYYIRQDNYDYEDIKKVWQKMLAWIYTNKITDFEQIGIYHDNPIITPKNNCHYVACIIPKSNTKLINTNLPSFDIYEGICATFEIEGYDEDMLKLLQWIYLDLLPKSGYEAITIPSYIVFEENHFLRDDGFFKGVYHIPVRYV
jgi:AraC family transcriptional regulator